ncbi:MAG: M20 metallopeptidase family protein [Candidatus Dormibacteria bacterium]
MSLNDSLHDDSRALAADLVALRHQLHAHPEVGLDLPVTQRTVLETISGLDLEVSTGTSVSSVTAVLRGVGTGPAVLLRGDMDALPVQEQTGLDFSSTVPGVMHACGHDLHAAMLVGAARLLAAHREALEGDVVFMFQPGEEGWDGAGRMLAEGVLDAAGHRVASAYGIHVLASQVRRGTFTTRPGTIMAASDGLHVRVHGAGGHGSTPHLARDPVTAAAEMVTSLQTLVTRRFDIFDPVVVTVGSFHAGTLRNVIPDVAQFEATVRSFSTRAQDRIRAEAPALCHQIAAAYGMEAEVEYLDEYPLTINDATHSAFAADVVGEVFGPARYEPMLNPTPAAEDFSRVLAAVPGCYLMLGADPGDSGQAPTNHSPRAAFADDVMPDGALLLAHLAIRALRRDAKRAHTGTTPLS